MQLTFVRHAEPAWFIQDRGVNDPMLSERGKRQADLVAEALLRFGDFDQLWVSPANRARDTAAPIAAALGKTEQILPWLLEVRTPDFRDKTPDEVRDIYRDADTRPVPEWWEAWAGAEPLRDFVARVEQGLDRELTELGAERAADDRWGIWTGLPEHLHVLVVSHAGTTGAALSHLLGLPQVPWAWKRMMLGHAAIAQVRTVRVAHGTIFGLRAFNDREHLRHDLRTH